MVESDHLLERNGRYQLFARVRDPTHAEGIGGYIVTTLAGDVIREEPTLAMARAWIDRLVEIDCNALPAPAAHAPRMRSPRR